MRPRLRLSQVWSSGFTLRSSTTLFHNISKQTFIQWTTDLSRDVSNSERKHQIQSASIATAAFTQPDLSTTLSDAPSSSSQAASQSSTTEPSRRRSDGSGGGQPNGAEAKIISGSAVAQSVQEELKKQIALIKEKGQPSPALAVILVGERKDSQTYVRMKTKACEAVGIGSQQFDLPSTITQEELLKLIAQLNADRSLNGILLQLPLPDHLDAELVINTIDPIKDVDGLTVTNAGKVAKYGHKSELVACTPAGCLELLDRHNVKIEGKHAVVVGRSDLVGRPASYLLLSRNATVTMCHSRTSNLPYHIKQADILIAAIGKPEFIRGEWIKPGAVVIDVGTNPVNDTTKKAGYRLVGDVEFAVAKKFASAITPVPGGVGPMTVAMLLRNTVKAYHLQQQRNAQP